MPLECECRNESGVLYIKLIGEMTYDNLSATTASVKQFVDSKPEATRIDLSEVSYISEDGMAFLISMYRDTTRRGANLYLEGAKGTVADRIRRAGLDRFIKPTRTDGKTHTRQRGDSQPLSVPREAEESGVSSPGSEASSRR